MARPSLPLLPIRLDAPACVGGQSEDLQVFLKNVGHPEIERRLGREKSVGQQDRVHTQVGNLMVLRTEGEKFKGRSGTTQGGRILLVDPDHSTGSESGVIAAVNWTKIGPDAVVSNICVRPDSRRKGLGVLLIDLARRQFPKIKADSNITIAGAMLMGYEDAVKANLANDAASVALAAHSSKKPSP